jgi:hypothetical protein
MSRSTLSGEFAAGSHNTCDQQIATQENETMTDDARDHLRRGEDDE